MTDDELIEKLKAATALPWRAAQNEWNLKNLPWSDALLIEGDVNGQVAVEPLICALYRGGGQQENAALIVAAVNNLGPLLDRLKEAEGESRPFRALKDTGWFDEIAEFLDRFQDAEIVEGRTHPNAAMRLLAQLQEQGL